MKWFAVLLVFSSVAQAHAATINAASCSQASVASAVASASPGDTVKVPAGTCSWSGGISITGIQLAGAGSSASGTVITAGSVTMTKHPTAYTRLTGFRFTGGDQHVSAGGAASAKPYIIDNNYFRSDVSSKVVRLTSNGGLLHHNQFTAVNWTSQDVFNILTTEDWSAATTFGTSDTTGERNIYFEDNTFTNISETAPDGDVGSRLVIRYNTYVDSSIVFHGGYPTDSSPNGGIRQFEVYNNTFQRVSNSVPINKWIWVRGGTGIIANNNMGRAESPDGFSYPSKVEILLTVGCPTSYPVQYQVGQSKVSVENPPTRPLAIFGNTGAATGDGNFIQIRGSSTAGPSCSSPDTYIRAGRDYVTSNTWGWAPYSYPHPLQSLQVGGPAGGSSSLPQSPSNLRIVSQ